ncbi:MAG: hypothetical protein IJH94_04825 [Clostridia bacterium]|nr:hypothetical protein [Clostridia bacterium]
MKMKRIISAATVAAVLAALIPGTFAAEVNETYDDILVYNDCETETGGVTLESDAPDGSSFYTTDSSGYQGAGDTTNSSEHRVYEADVRFNEQYSGFTVRDTANKKYMTAVKRYDYNGTPMLSVQTGGSSYARYVEIDTTAWYHVQLIGGYANAADPILMQVYKWEDGKKVFVGEYDNVTKRNDIASGYIQFEGNTSFDNVQITRLGADTITITSIPENTTEINAGASLTLTYGASRDARTVTAPAVDWKVYESGSELTDGSVTVSSEGIVTASRQCGNKTVTVKAISQEKGNPEGEYELTINAVNFSDLKFDAVTLTAAKDYVTADEPLALNVTATKDGSPVTLEDGDIYFYIYDENNLQEIGNELITVENGILSVDERVVSQNICVHAGDYAEVVYASLPVHVKATDATELGETGSKEQILFVDAGENTNNEYITSGSWDGSHYYNYTGSAVAASVAATGEDVAIEFDVKFIGEGEMNVNTGGKVGGQFLRSGKSIGRRGSGNKFTAICSGDSESWYHVIYMLRTGGEGSNYALVNIYKYGSDGQLVHPNTGVADLPATGTLDLRTVSSSNIKFSVLNVNDGIALDNIRILKIKSDAIELKTTTNTIFAGQSVQGSYTVSRQGTQLTYFPSDNITWALLDENGSALADDTISIDSTGLVTTTSATEEQTIFLKVTATDSGVYDTQPITIKGSDLFKITGIGVSEDGNAVTELKVQKDFFYNGDVVFIITAYDENNRMIATATRSVHNNTYAIGESRISVNMELAESVDSVKAMVWTSLE